VIKGLSVLFGEVPIRWKSEIAHPCRLKLHVQKLNERDYGCVRRSVVSRRRGTEVSEDEWIKTLAGGRSVKFTYLQLPDDGAFITAQIEGNEVVYSVVLSNAGNPLSRGAVESHFKGELSKKSRDFIPHVPVSFQTVFM